MNRPIVLLLMLTACDTALHFREGISPSCREAMNHSDFQFIQQEIFAPSCSLSSSCHKGTRPAGELNLETAKAYDQLVNKVSRLPDWVRVVPEEPDMSYILVKLGRIQGPLGMNGSRPGTTMPPDQPLCEEKIDAVRRWIEAGAPGLTTVDAGAGD